MSYIPALMQREGGKIRRGGKNAMLRWDRSVYDSSRSLHRIFAFHFANLAGHFPDVARIVAFAIYVRAE
jgi:hypothetical protein